jgi:hypothetical protein
VLVLLLCCSCSGRTGQARERGEFIPRIILQIEERENGSMSVTVPGGEVLKPVLDVIFGIGAIVMFGELIMIL